MDVRHKKPPALRIAEGCWEKPCCKILHHRQRRRKSRSIPT